VRYEASGSPLFVAICHCTMCRRAHAAPAVAWAMFRDSDVAFTGKRALYKSSADAERGFCGACGTQISFTAGNMPGLIDLTVGSLDRPQDVTPTLHYWDAERLPWLKVADGLPRHAGSPPS
jgi:hypothetical protein